MTTKLIALTFTFVILLTQPHVLLAQEAQGLQDWGAVSSVPSGAKIVVETKNGERTEGRLNSTSDTTTTLIRNNQTVVLSRDQVQRIYRLEGGSRVKSTFIGTGVGAGAGAGTAAAVLGATGGSDETSAFVAILTAVGAGVGAAIGAAAGKGRRRTLIFESR
jgi:hypothetical protein